jgi:hypothetical protein
MVQREPLNPSDPFQMLRLQLGDLSQILASSQAVEARGNVISMLWIFHCTEFSE